MIPPQRSPGWPHRDARPARTAPHRLVCAVLLALLFSGSGCAYYNTFYLARKYYNQGIQEEKRNTTGRLSPQATERFDKSIKQAEKILVRYPNSKWVDDALFLMGRAHFGREEYGSARARFDELLSRFPGSDFEAEARFWIGRTHFAENDFVKAIESFESVQAAGLDPEWGDEVLYFLGEVSFAREDYPAAIERYRDLVARFPNGVRAPAALARIGDAQFARRQFDEALRSYETAIVRVGEARDRFDLRIKIGQCLEKQQQFDEALSLYRETAYELVPPDRFARIMADPEEIDRATIEQALRDQEEQIARRSTESGTPPPADAGTVEAQAAREQQIINQLGEANRRAATEAIAQNPLVAHLPRILLRQGLCYSAAGDQKAAIRTFRSIVTAFPRTAESGEAQYRIAYVQEVEFQDYEAARKSYDQVKQQGSSLFTEQAARRASGLTRLIALAAADSSKGGGAKSLEAEAERAFLAAELFLFQQEKPEKALEEYTRVEADFPHSSFAPRAALARAWILSNTLGDTTRAAEVYRGISEKYPGTDPWRQAYTIVHGVPPKEEPKAAPPVPADTLLTADGAPADTLLAAGGAAARVNVTGAPASDDSTRVARLAVPPPVVPGVPRPDPGVPPSSGGAGSAPPVELADVAGPAAADSAARTAPAVAVAGAAPVPKNAIVPGLPHRLPGRIAVKGTAGLPKSWVEWKRTQNGTKPAPGRGTGGAP